MAKVSVMGGDAKHYDQETVGEIKSAAGAVGYVATVNGDPAGDSQEVSEFDFVALTKPVKAG